jgi:hypothetical protein
MVSPSASNAKIVGEDDHGLAQREQREDRRVDEDELDVRKVEEPRLDQGCHEHEQGEHGDDAELPQPEDEIDEPPGACRVGGRRGRRAGLDCRGHAAASSRCPVAAATIDSSVASA